MAGARRKSRITIFQALYEIDSTGHNAEDVIKRLVVEKKLSAENGTFIRHHVMGVIQNKQELDENIERFAPAWPVDQLPVVDSNILRFAIFELLMDNKVPTSIKINEAVELAKKFGSDSSARFVNGVLSSVNTLATR